MMIYKMGEKEFSCVFNYKDNDNLRNDLNHLAQIVYGFNFEQWYQDGYWGDAYIPYSLIFEDVIVANVSISLMNLNVAGKKKKYIQLGTVMTKPEFRNMGLSRALIGKIIESWSGKCDLIYLFANESVLDFYPKLGFQKANEYQLSKALNSHPAVMTAEKVDMENKVIVQRFAEKAARAKVFSPLALEHNVGLIMFYATSFMKENVYYISKYDAYVIALFDNDTLYLQGLFCEIDIELDKIMKEIAVNETKKVVLGFTPSVNEGFTKSILKGHDTLFVLGKDAEEIIKSQIMFPVLSHA